MLTADKLKAMLSRYMVAPDTFVLTNASVNFDLIASIPLTFFNLLDCGCGFGENMVNIEHTFANSKSICSYGIDVHYPTIKRAKELLPSKISVLLGNCLEMPIADNSIDVALSNQVIEHIRDYHKYLTEISRLLKPGGYLIITTPNAHCPRNILLKLLGHKPILRWTNVDNLSNDEFRGHVQEFTEAEFEGILQQHHFSIIQNRPLLPKPYLDGNWAFNLYTILEYLFYLCSKFFVAKGYSKNINLLCRLQPH